MFKDLQREFKGLCLPSKVYFMVLLVGCSLQRSKMVSKEDTVSELSNVICKTTEILSFSS